MRDGWRAAAPGAGIALGLAMLVATRGLDEAARGEHLGPGFWPRLALLGLTLACAIKAFTSWRAPVPASRVVAEPDSLAPGRLAAAITLIVLYVLLTPLVGFALATAAFVAAFMGVAGARSVAGIGASAVIGPVALLYLFIKFVYLPLPKGDGPFEALTLALYRALRIF